MKVHQGLESWRYYDEKSLFAPHSIYRNSSIPDLRYPARPVNANFGLLDLRGVKKTRRRKLDISTSLGTAEDMNNIDRIPVPELQEEISVFGSERQSEIVGLRVKGRRVHERLVVEDLDTIVTGRDQRLMPLFRILRAFQIQFAEEDNLITFHPEGAQRVVIDLQARDIEIGPERRDLLFLEASSIVTMKRDLYLLPEVMSEILNMDIKWDNELYEYYIQLDRKLSIWKRKESTSLFAIDTFYIPTDIPEAHPMAQISDSLIHFFESKVGLTYRWQRPDQKDDPAHTLTLSSPMQTLWGQLLGGRYKMQMSERSAVWDDTPEGLRWAEKKQAVATLSYFEWVKQISSSAEFAVGDSSFGLGELVFPNSRLAGFRFNGLIGFSEEELEGDKSDFGLNKYFNMPYVFEGVAPVGATVELLLNDDVVDTAEVFSDQKTPLGTGTYRFDDVRLPNGILNEITIKITELDGTETQIEKAIFGSPSLLPAGKSAYLGALGSRRDTSLYQYESNNPELGEMIGKFIGGRFLHGVTDRLTLGAMVGLQRDFFRHYSRASTLSGYRSYPDSSQHFGTSFSWLATDRLLFSGDVAKSQGVGDSSYNDTAYRLRGEYLPYPNLSFNVDYLNLGKDYFDGGSLSLSDRQAMAISGRWSPHKKWTLEGTIGKSKNNLDGSLDETTSGKYRSMSIRTTILPRTTVVFTVDQLKSSWDPNTQTLKEIKVRTSPWPGFDIYGQCSWGDTLDLAGNSALFTGLKLPDTPRAREPELSLSVRKSLPNSNSISFHYLLQPEMPENEMITLSHDVSIPFKRGLRIHTEFSRDLEASVHEDKYIFRNRVDYLLNDTARSRFGLQTEFRSGKWETMLYLTMNDLFSQYEGRLIASNDRRVRGDIGGVHGKVFMDYNANTILDPNEPGVPGIKVNLSRAYSATTDKDGYYILSAPRNIKEARIYLDIDTVPAIYSPTHGMQLVKFSRWGLAKVNLGLTPLISISGKVISVDPNDVYKAIPGIRVLLTDPNTDKFVADSITAGDGSYYLGDIRPGEYNLQLDMKTIPPDCNFGEPKRKIEVIPQEDFQQLLMGDFKGILTPREDDKEHYSGSTSQTSFMNPP
ncbi:MAG: hypothetical protein JW806_00570 [Sedimentisphaerales bacterium]|nr:hypothetical protein [Sedimentisphaerales bacterium]